MAYSGDRYQHCRKCGKNTKHVRCPRCRGSRPAFTQCGHCGNTDRKCENGVNDPGHR